MINDFIKYIQEDEDILYGYFLPPELFGVDFGVTKYVLITKWAYKVPDKYKNIPIIHFPIQLYFKYIINNDLTAWILSCLDKKYIIKEYVKLLINFDVLKIRKNIDNDFKFFDELLYGNFAFDDIKAYYSKMYKYLVFANQIIENHKITNYHIVNSGLKLINNVECSTITEVYFKTIRKEYKKLIDKTEKLRRKELIKMLKNE